MKFMNCLLFVLLLAGLPLKAEENCNHDDKTFRCVKLLSVYDGDTITIEIPNVHPLFGKKIGVRVRGIDTPEISTKDKCEKDAGRIARNLAESLLKTAKRIDLENIGRDKYFRVLADVRVDGKLLSEVMLKNNLAYTYDGGTKQHLNWCDYLKKNRVPASDGGKK